MKTLRNKVETGLLILAGVALVMLTVVLTAVALASPVLAQWNPATAAASRDVAATHYAGLNETERGWAGDAGDLTLAAADWLATAQGNVKATGTTDAVGRATAAVLLLQTLAPGYQTDVAAQVTEEPPVPTPTVGAQEAFSSVDDAGARATEAATEVAGVVVVGDDTIAVDAGDTVVVSPAVPTRNQWLDAGLLVVAIAAIVLIGAFATRVLALVDRALEAVRNTIPPEALTYMGSAFRMAQPLAENYATTTAEALDDALTAVFEETDTRLDDDLWAALKQQLDKTLRAYKDAQAARVAGDNPRVLDIQPGGE